MSQIASAYVLSVEQIETLARSTKAKDWKEFWNQLTKMAGEVVPGYGFSGFVVNVLMAYLEEREVQLPLSLDKPPFSEIAAGEMGLQVCADHSDAKTALECLSKIPVDESDLLRFFNAFTCDDWDEAGVAMKEAWDFVARGLQAVKDEKDCYMLFVG